MDVTANKPDFSIMSVENFPQRAGVAQIVAIHFMYAGLERRMVQEQKHRLPRIPVELVGQPIEPVVAEQATHTVFRHCGVIVNGV